MVGKFYPNLDLSNITIPAGALGEELADDIMAPIEEVAPVMIKTAPAVTVLESVKIELATIKGHKIRAVVTTDTAEEEIDW